MKAKLSQPPKKPIQDEQDTIIPTLGSPRDISDDNYIFTLSRDVSQAIDFNRHSIGILYNNDFNPTKRLFEQKKRREHFQQQQQYASYQMNRANHHQISASQKENQRDIVSEYYNTVLRKKQEKRRRTAETAKQSIERDHSLIESMKNNNNNRASTNSTCRQSPLQIRDILPQTLKQATIQLYKQQEILHKLIMTKDVQSLRNFNVGNLNQKEQQFGISPVQLSLYTFVSNDRKSRETLDVLIQKGVPIDHKDIQLAIVLQPLITDLFSQLCYLKFQQQQQRLASTIQRLFSLHFGKFSLKIEQPSIIKAFAKLKFNTITIERRTSAINICYQYDSKMIFLIKISNDGTIKVFDLINNLETEITKVLSLSDMKVINQHIEIEPRSIHKTQIINDKSILTYYKDYKSFSTKMKEKIHSCRQISEIPQQINTMKDMFNKYEYNVQLKDRDYIPFDSLDFLMILFDIGVMTLFEMNYDQSQIISNTFRELYSDIKLNGIPKKIIISRIFVITIEYQQDAENIDLTQQFLSKKKFKNIERKDIIIQGVNNEKNKSLLFDVTLNYILNV